MPAQKCLTPGQCRAARGFLDWTQDELAERTGLSRSTVRAFEKCHHDLHAASETRIVETFREAGITFSSGGPEGCRVCLKPVESVEPDPV
ncbi:helix-turn-helix transcriptional regulator [Azospirillum doebereinerae]